MSFKPASRLQAVTDELTNLRDQVRDIAAEQFPRIADAAQRTGNQVARASSSAGRSAVRHLRAVPPSIGETAHSLRKSSAAKTSMRFLTSRPALAAAGVFVVATAGLAIWRRMRSPAEDQQSPESDTFGQARSKKK